MKHYYFIEEESGEEFLVGADSLTEAREIAREIVYQISREYEIIPNLSYEYEMTEEEAEASGLDEY